MFSNPIRSTQSRRKPIGFLCFMAALASLVARFEGCEERNAAQALKGSEVALERAALPQNAKDEYYWADLVGLEVVNMRGEELGRVAGLFDNGAHAVMRVVAGETERLLPFVEQVVRPPVIKFL